MPYTEILSSVIGVMNKTASDARSAIVQRLFEGIEHKARMRRPADPPADNAAGEHIDNESDVDKPDPGRDAGEIADPEPVRCRGLEVAVHMVERARRCLVAVGRAMRLASDNTHQPHGLDEAPDSATCNVEAFPLHLVPDLVGAIGGEVLVEDPKDLRLQRLIPAGARRLEFGAPPPRVRLMTGGWSDRQYPADRLDPVNITMIVNEADHVFGRRSSSACAK